MPFTEFMRTANDVHATAWALHRALVRILGDKHCSYPRHNVIRSTIEGKRVKNDPSSCDCFEVAERLAKENVPVNPYGE